jgi:hypothetical protein
MHLNRNLHSIAALPAPVSSLAGPSVKERRLLRVPRRRAVLSRGPAERREQKQAEDGGLTGVDWIESRGRFPYLSYISFFPESVIFGLTI